MGSTMYGQNITTATTGKYLRIPEAPVSILHVRSIPALEKANSHHGSSSRSFPMGTPMSRCLLGGARSSILSDSKLSDSSLLKSGASHG
jgi:hypothetical protein